MKKFKYRIESYFKFLMFKRENAFRELKVAENYRNNLVKKFHQMEEQIRQAYQMNSEFGKAGLNIHFVNDNNQFIELLKANMQNLSIEIEQAEFEYRKKHQALVGFQVQVKKVELHKELEFEKYRVEVRKKNQKLTDEINGTRKRGQNAKSV